MKAEENPFFEKPKQDKKSNPLVDFLQSIVIAMSIAIILYLFVITPNQVDGPSMQPNFQDNELLLTNRLTQWIGHTQLGQSLGLDYQRGDVVIFHKPDMQDPLIKRIIGLAGDRIAIRDGYFYVNNKKYIEYYLPKDTQEHIQMTYTIGGNYLQEGAESIVVPEGYFFVSGDHRAVSYDSRSLGPIKRDWLRGKVILRFWPLPVFRLIQTGEYSFE